MGYRHHSVTTKKHQLRRESGEGRGARHHLVTAEKTQLRAYEKGEGRDGGCEHHQCVGKSNKALIEDPMAVR